MLRAFRAAFSKHTGCRRFIIRRPGFEAFAHPGARVRVLSTFEVGQALGQVRCVFSTSEGFIRSICTDSPGIGKRLNLEKSLTPPPFRFSHRMGAPSRGSGSSERPAGQLAARAPKQKAVASDGPEWVVWERGGGWAWGVLSAESEGTGILGAPPFPSGGRGASDKETQEWWRWTGARGPEPWTETPFRDHSAHLCPRPPPGGVPGEAFVSAPLRQA